jgi:hypothetical protein
VSASTFTGNTGGLGGAIDSGDEGGAGSVTVYASTFTGNTANNAGGAIGSGARRARDNHAASAGDIEVPRVRWRLRCLRFRNNYSVTVAHYPGILIF